MLLGLRASLQPWNSFLNRFAEHVLGFAACSIQISLLGMDPNRESRRPGGVGRGKGSPNSAVEVGCTLTKILRMGSRLKNMDSLEVL